MTLRPASLLLIAACAGPDVVDLGPARTLEGELTWDVRFSEAAQQAGHQDCAYVRTYTEGVEARHSPWLCPGCEVMAETAVEMTEGLESCFRQFSTQAVAAREWLGWGEGRFRRAGWQNMLLAEQGDAALEGHRLAVQHEVDIEFEGHDGATHGARLLVHGELEVGESEALDPMRGLSPPATYACGWPQVERAPYQGDWVVQTGGVLPDGHFLDRCGEGVRLHHLTDGWMVLAISAADCGPCRSMAAGAADFEADMASRGIPTRVVTLLVPSLTNPLGEPDVAQLQAWHDGFGVKGAVLADRGYGIWAVAVPLEAMTGAGFGYPGVVVVDPQLRVRGMKTGFGGWQALASEIESLAR